MNKMLNGSHIVDIVNVVSARTRRSKFVVAFTFPVDRDLVETLLRVPSVRGVILSDESEWKKLPKSENVGFRHRPGYSLWRYPRSSADTVIVFGGREWVGLRVVSTAFGKCGIRYFAFTDGTVKSIEVYSSAALSLRLVIRSIRSRVRPRIRLQLNLYKLRERTFALRLPVMLRVCRKFAPPVDPTETAVLVIGSLRPGGSERQAVNTAVMIKRLGTLRPVVVCARLGDEESAFYRSILDDAGVDVVDLRQVDITAACSGAHQRLIGLYRSEGEKLGYDMVDDLLRYLIFLLNVRPKIVHSFLDENNIKAGIAAVIARVPKIILSGRNVAPDNFLLFRRYMRPGYRALMRFPSVALCNNSRAGAMDYRRWLRAPSLKIDVVYNGIDFATFSPKVAIDRALRGRLGISPQALVVGTVIRLNEEKQPTLWARVAIELSRRRPDVDFVLVGDGPLRDSVKRIVAIAGIESRVHFIRGTEDVAGVLRELDVFLLTSRLEGLPNVLVEAQAVGVPVVTTPAGGAVETLNPGVTGFVAPDQSVRGIADTCLVLLDDDRLRARMSAAATEFVRDRFSLDRMIKDTLRLYEA